MSAHTMTHRNVYLPSTWIMLLVTVLVAVVLTVALVQWESSRTTAAPPVPTQARVVPSPSPGPMAVANGSIVLG